MVSEDGTHGDSVKRRMLYRFLTPEPLVRIELTTSSLPRKCSTTELQRHSSAAAPVKRAGDEVRTRDLQLGRLSLYQLSYSRMLPANAVAKAGDYLKEHLLVSSFEDSSKHLLKLRRSKWARMDSNHRTPKRTDLQSVAVGHLATCPSHEPEKGLEPPTS